METIALLLPLHLLVFAQISIPGGLLCFKIQLDLLRSYEKGSVGGRLQSLHIGDQPYELGGSMVYEGNHYIRCAP